MLSAPPLLGCGLLHLAHVPCPLETFSEARRKVLDLDDAVSRLLDGQTMMRSDRPLFVKPLVDELWRYIEQPGQLGSTPEEVACFLEAHAVVKHSFSQLVKRWLIPVAPFTPDNQAMLKGREFGDYLRRLAKARKLTNTKLSDAAGVSLQAVNGWFATGRIGRSSLAAVAPLLGMTVDQLMAGAPYLGLPQADGKADLFPEDEAQLLIAWRRLTPKQKAEELRRVQDIAASNVDLIQQLGHLSANIDNPVSNEYVEKHLPAIPRRASTRVKIAKGVK